MADEVFLQGLICAKCLSWGSSVITTKQITDDVAFIGHCGHCNTSTPFVGSIRDAHGRELGFDKITEFRNTHTLKFVASYDERFKKYLEAMKK